jgi:hypothetical protein
LSIKFPKNANLWREILTPVVCIFDMTVRFFDSFNQVRGANMLPTFPIFLRLCVFNLLGLLAACTAAPLTGVTGSQARQKFGEPTMVVQTSQGARWFYPSGPFGTTTRAVDVDRAEVVTSVQNVLVDDAIQTINVGLTLEEVIAKIGPPHRRVRFDNLRATSWDYRYQDTWGYVVDLSIMIDDENRVTGKVLQRLEKDDAAR